MSVARALRRAAAPLRRCAAPYLVDQPTLTAASGRSFTAAVEGSAAGVRSAPLWTLSRMASTAREVGRESDGGLLSVLRAELDHERKTYSQPKEVSRGPPKPWTLTDKQGHADIILRRSHGQEDIAVTCVYQPDTYGENHADDEPEGSDQDERDDESASCVNMTITVNKGADNPTLEISATSYGNEISIDHVYFWEDKDSRDALYDGPNFMQLDEELQTQFEKYIKARGVNRELVSYLFQLLDDKEQREYMRWLQKVESFIKQ
ncbi:complement component 1 Q subcomponent-binding protein, mitochondrial [Marchantia polymorpha subsp. ruderalis]|uniref:Mitochondrial glycoprotein n=2 Tax=Marchantia polymorpha TaxID=3197 RepID=A0A176VZR4_MARPO|nr:hypothetical protein AXG93_3040s1180 [Marchantia polymorpha subsp. ruderalis]PTQ50541.1 hypothetical protein MARPO_0001s0479 [Marchantia polymorpha]PTQ50542.1 hypothetical protein MARPO_0001s0479 [Marchantia polymorpha]BBM99459.1 hypothetical protein Mp_1g21440 [Marchantia polymorpha subsp. ruderalis]BBM99460.1 hypothetical protein Mp_1g21440 [Marchantia polymorpha subsp. ruderalis]|eukprot:PTQ50541.1 hypothetical protein MARPO_0001s0479 [Marchantia polymorpha]